MNRPSQNNKDKESSKAGANKQCPKEQRKRQTSASKQRPGAAGGRGTTRNEPSVSAKAPVASSKFHEETKPLGVRSGQS